MFFYSRILPWIGMLASLKARTPAGAVVRCAIGLVVWLLVTVVLAPAILFSPIVALPLLELTDSKGLEFGAVRAQGVWLLLRETCRHESDRGMGRIPAPSAPETIP
ncbi:MAG: hypothetical protein ACKVX7_04765 [Planctomycetota bacterium]